MYGYSSSDETNTAEIKKKTARKRLKRFNVDGILFSFEAKIDWSHVGKIFSFE